MERLAKLAMKSVPGAPVCFDAAGREPTLAELMDPVALERRLAAARIRRSQALAHRAAPEPGNLPMRTRATCAPRAPAPPRMVAPQPLVAPAPPAPRARGIPSAWLAPSLRRRTVVFLAGLGAGITLAGAGTLGLLSPDAPATVAPVLASVADSAPPVEAPAETAAPASAPPSAERPVAASAPVAPQSRLPDAAAGRRAAETLIAGRTLAAAVQPPPTAAAAPVATPPAAPLRPLARPAQLVTSTRAATAPVQPSTLRSDAAGSARGLSNRPLRAQTIAAVREDRREDAYPVIRLAARPPGGDEAYPLVDPPRATKSASDRRVAASPQTLQNPIGSMLRALDAATARVFNGIRRAGNGPRR